MASELAHTIRLSADRLSFIFLSKHANIYLKLYLNIKNWLISVLFINVFLIGWLLAHWLLVDEYRQILLIYPHVNFSMLMSFSSTSSIN